MLEATTNTNMPSTLTILLAAKMLSIKKNFVKNPKNGGKPYIEITMVNKYTNCIKSVNCTQEEFLEK